MSRYFSILAALILILGWTGAQAASVTLDGRLKKIRATKTLAIAYRTDAAPFASEGADKGPVGYSIDLCRQVADSIRQQLEISNLQVKWVPVTTQTRLTAVVTGQADMECGSTTITLTRMKTVDFSSIIFVDHTALLVKKINPAKGLSDLSGKIGVISGTSNERAVEDRVGRARIFEVDNREDGLRRLRSGEIEAFASDRVLLIGLVDKANEASAMALLTEPLSYEPYAIVLPRGDWAFRLAVNTALAQTYGSAEITKIHQRWFAGLSGMSPLMDVVYKLGALPK